MANNHPYAHAYKTLESEGKEYAYFSLPALGDERVERLPYSIRILLESVLRNCDEFKVTKADVEKLLNWKETSTAGVEIPYKPGRVLLQDFTGVPAVVDLAAMRDAMQRLGGDPQKINPLCPVDLVIDHSVQVDVARSAEALARNQEIEFDRNKERFAFLKWATKAFDNMLIVPPGSGIVHQVNLEYLARGVLEKDGVVYPDSLVGTDSHTTMIDGLGICGWGVGGIEAESVMLGQPISMVVPEVVGYELTGRLREPATATDLVLTITENLRKLGVVGKFVEFYGDGVACLSIADRATIANMAPEQVTLAYYRQTGRDEARVRLIEKYMESQEFLRNDGASKVEYSTTLSLDLGSVVPCVSGPKRPHDRIEVTKLKEDFDACMTAPGGFKGFGIPEDHRGNTASFTFDGKDYTLKHGDVVIAAITSCTNTSNPDVMVAAALLARNARARGLTTLPYIKTSLSPGSGVVTEYLSDSGLLGDMEALGFNVAGYGCMTCIGNSGDLDPSVANAIDAADIVASAVLSGNRNFEGRVHPQTRANYLASPPLVVAYALAGTVRIDFDNEPIGNDTEGKPVFLRDIWPSNAAVAETVANHLNPDMFRKVYGSIQQGTERWNSLASAEGALYQWDPESTYINNPPFFSSMNLEPKPRGAVHGARCLALLGSSITTDHISPAGRIAKNSAAAAYLQSRGVAPADFNTYGARRGHDEVMARGTFSNIRLRNLAATSPGPVSVHVPSGEEAMVCDVAFRYRNENTPVIVVGGADYGAGSSRDWAAKGPYLLGVRCVIAESFERIHRSNLVGMGIVPLQFKSDENAKSIGLTGKELFDIHLPESLSPGMDITVTTDTGKSFATRLRFDTAVELTYYHHGGILHYVLRQLLGSA